MKFMSKELSFENAGECPAFTTEYITRTEAMIGLEFDRSYLNFLEAHNGGVVKENRFQVDSNTKIVERFLCLTPDYATNTTFGKYDVGVVWSQIEDRLNDYLIPFASVFGGDFLCFDYEDTDEGQIVLWHYDKSEENQPYTTFVASNFDDFLNQLF